MFILAEHGTVLWTRVSSGDTLCPMRSLKSVGSYNAKKTTVVFHSGIMETDP